VLLGSGFSRGFKVGLLPGFAAGETDTDGFQMQSGVQGKNAAGAKRRQTASGCPAGVSESESISAAGRAQRVMADFPLHGAAHLIPRRPRAVGVLLDGVWVCFIWI